MDHYHYTESGLDYVYLANGFDIVETPHGRGVHIVNTDALHREIGLMIARFERPLAGAELRFLRECLELTQDGFAELIGYRDGQRVGAWERGEKPAPRAVETVLRELYLEANPSEHSVPLRQLLDRLMNASDAEPSPITLRAQDARWSPERVAA